MPQPSTIRFVQDFFKQQVKDFTPLSGSGSNRKYFRIILNNTESFILTENSFIAENETFIYLSKLFFKQGFNVPEIITINDDKTAYIQSDLGDSYLLQRLEKEGFSDEIYNLYEQSLIHLAQLQIELKNTIDFKQCYDFQAFDDKVVYNDLFYFKNYFLDRLDIPYQKGLLIADFETLAQKVNTLDQDFFLFRDFQSRNIMLHHNKPYFIDYQGGMQGFIGYDAVSLLYQAKAQLPQTWKEQLKSVYFKEFIAQNILTEEQLHKGFQLGLILRFFQVFGTYGLRGLVERKSHFLNSILFNFKNIEFLLEQKLLNETPHLRQVAQQIISQDTQLKIKQLLQI